MKLKNIANKIYNLSLKKIVGLIANINYRPGEQVFVINGKYVNNLKLNISRTFKDDYSAMISGNYENFIYDNVAKIDVAGKVIWDIGAHFGYHSFIFANLVGLRGKVFSFEPNPHNTEVFRKNLELNPEIKDRIVLMEVAVDAVADKQVIFRISPQARGTTTLGGFLDESSAPTDDAIYESFDKINVITKTIDHLAEEGLSMPDLIKIDVEGAEVKVLQGALKTIKNKKPILIIEIHTIANMARIAALLASLDYEYVILDETNPMFTKNILAKPREHH